MTVKRAKCLDDDMVLKREAEEQVVIEASIKARVGGVSVEGNPSSLSSPSSFGSNLDRDLQSRSRSRTLSGDCHEIAMSPEERRALEEEMRSQSHHPLVRQMNADAERESQRHVLEHRERRRDRGRNTQRQLEQLLGMRANANNANANAVTGNNRDNMSFRDRVSLFTGVGGDDLDEVEVNEETTARPSLDDLLMFEAALFLSMRDETRGMGSGNNARSSRRNSDGNNNTSIRNQTIRNGQSLRSTFDGGNAQNFIQAILHEREREERPNPFISSGGYGDDEETHWEWEIAEARQLEMAIQMSLQEANNRVQDEAEAGGGVGVDLTDLEQEEEHEDHGEEEIVFQHDDEGGNNAEGAGGEE